MEKGELLARLVTEGVELCQAVCALVNCLVPPKLLDGKQRSQRRTVSVVTMHCQQSELAPVGSSLVPGESLSVTGPR